MNQLALLANDLLCKFAIDNLKSNKDLHMWLGILEMSGPESAAPYDFLKSKIPDFEKRFQEELKKSLEKIHGK